MSIEIGDFLPDIVWRDEMKLMSGCSLIAAPLESISEEHDIYFEKFNLLQGIHDFFGVHDFVVQKTFCMPINGFSL